MFLIPAALLKVYTRLGWTHLSSHPGRTVLTMIGVALGVAATIAVQTANVEVLRSFEESVLTVAGPVTLEVTAGEAGLDERVIRAVREVDGVESARPVLEVAAAVAGGSRRSFSVVGLDLLDELNRADGRIPAVFETRNRRGEGVALEGLLRDNGLLVGEALAKDLGVEPGAQVALEANGRAISVSILAVMRRRPDAPSPWDHWAVMDIAAAQRTFGLTGRLDRIDVVTGAAVSVEQVGNAIELVLPPTVTVRRPIQRSQQVESMVRAFQLNLSMLSMVGLLVGIFLIYNTVSFMVAQRRKEVGILRAIGLSEPMVIGLFLVEAGVLGVGGGSRRCARDPVGERACGNGGADHS